MVSSIWAERSAMSSFFVSNTVQTRMGVLCSLYFDIKWIPSFEIRRRSLFYNASMTFDIKNDARLNNTV